MWKAPQSLSQTDSVLLWGQAVPEPALQDQAEVLLSLMVWFY